jgi:retron-type reverse transcriptase
MLNNQLILWAIGVLQPAAIEEIVELIQSSFPDVKIAIDHSKIKGLLESWERFGYVQKVSSKFGYYSLTLKGNARIPSKIRYHRDKTRLFLLKAARNVRSISERLSGDAKLKLDGASPSVDGSRELQEAARPVRPSASPRSPRATGRPYWPRVSKQLKLKAGSGFSSPDNSLRYYSFPTLAAIRKAAASESSSDDLSLSDLALAIGISPRLISSFIHIPNTHYRSFTIGKRSGGKRIINSPRTFLKVVQYWILDYLFDSLEIHPSCQSYQKEKSILTNALPHVGFKFLANIDIKDFFGSITQSMVENLLRKNKFGNSISRTISRIITLDNALPQGAPTSPIISNALLIDFDDAAFKFCKENGIVYTRYADDISLSGNNRNVLDNAIEYIGNCLNEYRLIINAEKLRVASKSGQQRVTGIVVNVAAAPPRMFRRKVRAMFHSIQRKTKVNPAELKVLRGYLSYLSSFPSLRDGVEVRKYKTILANFS